MKTLACAAALVLTAFTLAAQNPSPESSGAPRRPMTFEDLQKMRRLGDIDVSRDGRWVLFTVTDVDLGKNTRTPHLWIVPVEGGEEKPLTAAMAGESRGRFSPDGQQIAFLTDRGQGTQIWLAPFDSDKGTMGEPRQLTHISTEADNVTWDPDGLHLLFTSGVYPECSTAGQSGAEEDTCDKKRDDAEAESKVKARIFTSLLYRHWNHFTGDKRSHLFLAWVEDGTFRDLNPGDTHDVPPFSLGEPDGWDFSPDGKEIAFEEKKVDDPALSTNVDIFTLNLDDANAQPVKISASPGGDFTPRYSPDGKWIAWRMQRRAGYESDRFRLVLYDRSTKQIKELLPNFDRWVDEEAWGRDSKTIYFAAGDVGQEPIFALSIEDAHLIQETAAGEYSSLAPISDGTTLIAARMTVAEPSEVFSITALHSTEHSPFSRRFAPGAAPDRVSKLAAHPSAILMSNAVAMALTHLNTSLLAQLDLPKMESFWFPSIGNVRVQGFIIRPPNFDEHKKYPVKFLIHGGPQGAWGDSWSYRWNPELFAANGYVVVMINPGGSTGYGQAFVDRVNGDWGGRPFIDLMRGLDYAEAHYAFIDKSRECALGASYGGYMANWILGHTNRFKCIVSHDGMFNPESAWGTTEELWFNEWEFKGTPWSNRALYRKWSPMLAETSFKTPTLVVHSQLDYRLDVSEGYQLFDTLQRMKVPSKMLYFPDEGHWILKPQNSQLWYKTVNDWVDQWTKK
ncbi:MAG TPA: S9 family peptidase [Acidobacteriaceae bacterium]|jgi:dipeptidyl aminopeptidase/acylaminoacyl peptidase|nr:S9 family peptidase [Acidobacteriaceae bacterium]